MAASRRAQVQALCGVRSGALIDRVESYLAAVEVWSRRGNAKAFKNAGTGVVAVCCLLAAESLDIPTPDRIQAIRASGLKPDRFALAERDFRNAVQSVSNVGSQKSTSTASSDTTVPSSILQRNNPILSATRQARSSPLASPSKSRKVTNNTSHQALLAKAQAVQAGNLFDQTMRAAKPPATITDPAAGPAHQASAADSLVPASDANYHFEAATSGASFHWLQLQRPPKRKRMSRLVSGLDVHSDTIHLTKEEQAGFREKHRLRVGQTQTSINTLSETGNLCWCYRSFPQDFMITVLRDEL